MSNGYVIGTIKTRLDGKTVPYYPETMAEAISVIPPNSENGEKATLQELIDTGRLSGGGTPLRHKDGFDTATQDGQKIFKVEMEPDMPPLIKMGLDVHVKSIWISPTRYRVEGSNIILNDDEEGLLTGEKLEYTLHYGETGGCAISMDKQVIVVEEPDVNVFDITKANYSPSRYAILPVIGGTVIVPDRYTVTTNNKGGYCITFKDFDSFDLGRVITLLFFYDTPATGLINGGSLVQLPAVTIMRETGRIIPIPLDDYSSKKYTIMMFVNSTFIAPRRYTIDEDDKRIILKDTEDEIKQGKTIDFIFTAIQKDISMVENVEIENLKSLITHRHRTIKSSEWESDSTYSEFPYSATIVDYDIRPEHVINVTFPMDVALKYSGIICTGCEATNDAFKVYAYEIPKEDITIKYLIGR